MQGGAEAGRTDGGCSVVALEGSIRELFQCETVVSLLRGLDATLTMAGFNSPHEVTQTIDGVATPLDCHGFWTRDSAASAAEPDPAAALKYPANVTPIRRRPAGISRQAVGWQLTLPCEGQFHFSCAEAPAPQDEPILERILWNFGCALQKIIREHQHQKALDLHASRLEGAMQAAEILRELEAERYARLQEKIVELATTRQQLELAGSIQRRLLPGDTGTYSGLQLSGFNLACDETGGDFYDFMKFADGRILLVLADAVGHGIGAAMIAHIARASLRALLHNAHNGVELGEVCGSLNQLMAEDLNSSEFMTMFIGIYDPGSRVLEYVNAGHPHPLIVCENGENLRELESNGIPVGIISDMQYNAMRTAPLNAGDHVLIRSDGIEEAVNHANELFGEDRIVATLLSECAAPVQDLCASLVDRVINHCDGQPQQDDMTLVCFKVE